jgi:endonuclease/exonuclease/phosphatase family metal-dependent hydrolase
VAGAVITFAWWNTGLAPPSLEISRKDEHRTAAAAVVSKLVDAEGCSLIALAEVRRERVVDWIASGHGSWELVSDTSGQRHDFDVALLIDTSRLRLEEHAWVEGYYSSQRVRAGLVVRLSTAHGPLLVAAAHWRSDASNAKDADARRQTAAQALLGEISRQTSLLGPEVPILLMGDLNVEPYELHGVASARSRDIVRAHKPKSATDLLWYNASWRFLGERTPMADRYTATLAGTYRGNTNVPTAWRTFDHVLVSPTLLGRPGHSGWLLREEALGVWVDDDVYDAARSRPRSPFDHLPIRGRLEWVTDESEASR